MNTKLIKKNNKSGFTLIELILVLSVGMAISFLSFQSLVTQQENILSKSVGQHIKQVAESTNIYIVNHFDVLSSLKDSTSSSTDPGPRICSTVSNTCSITVQTLINEGFLPTTYLKTNSTGAGYTITLKRSGVSPYYKINGLVLTDKSFIGGNSNKIRYDLLGKAMQESGIDSGMTRVSSSVLEGYKGSWNYTSNDYSEINKQGLLGYQVGFGTDSYSVFLRRDGTLPMTGSLNMGGNDIYNAKDITATGKGDFGGEVTATNGYGDKITLGGDAAGSDYELRLNTAKPLSVFSPNIPSSERPTTTVFKTNGQMQVIGNTLVNNSLATNGYAVSDMPSGWSGLRTADILASGTIGIAKNGTTGSANDKAFYATQYGNAYASNSITSGGWIWGTNGYGNQIGLGGDAGSNDYEIKMMTDAPLSIHMNSNRSDLTTVKVTGAIYASGNIETGKYIKISNSVSAGSGCSEAGLLSRDSAGQILSCQSGLWIPEQPVGIPQPWPSTTPPNGWLICNGQSFNLSQYPLLAKAYPSGKLPDLRGSFIRGLDQGRGIDSGRTVLSDQRSSVVGGTDDNWSDNDFGVLHGPSSAYSRDSINVYDYTTGSNGQDPKYWVHMSSGTGPSTGNSETASGGIKLSNNGSNGFYGGARPYNTSFVYIVRAL